MAITFLSIHWSPGQNEAFRGLDLNGLEDIIYAMQCSKSIERLELGIVDPNEH
jgi:hypothetical protein